jgi:hypothetical protein
VGGARAGAGADAFPHAAAGPTATRAKMSRRGQSEQRAPQWRWHRRRRGREGLRGERPGRAPVQVSYLGWVSFGFGCADWG